MELKRPDKKRWRKDAKCILRTLRLFQDRITEDTGYEGFSLYSCTVNGLIEGKVVSIRYESTGDNIVVSLVENDLVLDTITLHKPRD